MCPEVPSDKALLERRTAPNHCHDSSPSSSAGNIPVPGFALRKAVKIDYEDLEPVSDAPDMSPPPGDNRIARFPVDEPWEDDAPIVSEPFPDPLQLWGTNTLNKLDH